MTTNIRTIAGSPRDVLEGPNLQTREPSYKKDREFRLDLSDEQHGELLAMTGQGKAAACTG